MFFWRSRCRPNRWILKSLLLKFGNFAAVATLEREGNWSRNASRNYLWDRYLWRACQLLAYFFLVPCNSPRSLCESQLSPGSFSFLNRWMVTWRCFSISCCKIVQLHYSFCVRRTIFYTLLITEFRCCYFYVFTGGSNAPSHGLLLVTLWNCR